MREFDNDIIQLINTFEAITKADVRDCIKNDMIYFVVNPGKTGQAIGKGGKTIKAAQTMLKTNIRIFEWAEDQKQFVKNLIPQAKQIRINGEEVEVRVGEKDKGAVIGKSGTNIKVLNEILSRNSELRSLRVL
ncbi:MAG: NusA-like transcription termination signal-binding factor [Candidatus Aenigmarchaeota archaeon]|nr:NusA-like transcription termination signal-binding factor [Candidatus Aenigmarchaeota archaeon]